MRNPLPFRRLLAGYTYIELLVVIAITGSASALLLPAVQQFRVPENQTEAHATVVAIGQAQVLYQASAGAGSYGSLQDLVAFGLIHPELAGGLRRGYSFTVQTTPSPTPTFSAVAQPLSAMTGTLRFYIDQTQVVRVSSVGTPGPSDPVLAPGGQTAVPPTVAGVRAQLELESLSRTAAVQALQTGPGATLAEAAALLEARPELLVAILNQFVEPGSSGGPATIDAERLLDGDLLDLARALAAGLGPSPEIGDDQALRAVLGNFQQALRERLQTSSSEALPPAPANTLDDSPEAVWRVMLESVCAFLLFADGFER